MVLMLFNNLFDIPLEKRFFLPVSADIQGTRSYNSNGDTPGRTDRKVCPGV
jgi:hypothetical protein